MKHPNHEYTHLMLALILAHLSEPKLLQVAWGIVALSQVVLICIHYYFHFLRKK